MNDQPQNSGERLAPATAAREPLRWVMIGVTAAWLWVLFHLLGNTVPDVPSGSAFAWMVARWNDSISYGTDYSIGWAIPFVSAWLVWRRRAEFAGAAGRPATAGLVVIVLCLALHWLGARTEQPRLSLTAFIGLLWSIPYFVYGWRVAALLLFPCSYLMFCIPFNFLSGVTFPLRLFASAASAVLLNGLGIPVERFGTIIRPVTHGGFDFNVDDPCSGLHSLFAMLALTAAYGYIVQRTPWKRWVLFLSAIPIAMAGNIIRIVTVALVGAAGGTELALKVYHDYSGYVVFLAAVLLMVSGGVVLDRVHGRRP
jgi:exosortase